MTHTINSFNKISQDELTKMAKSLGYQIKDIDDLRAFLKGVQQALSIKIDDLTIQLDGGGTKDMYNEQKLFQNTQTQITCCIETIDLLKHKRF